MAAKPLFLDASHAAGLSRLESFLPSAGREYARTRNFDFGPQNHGNVSLLSPYISHRLLLETDVLHRTLQQHTTTSAEKFIEEVFWRTYFKGWLEQRPGVWHDYRLAVDSLVHSLETNASLSERYEQAVAGRTGIDCFDAWVDELVATGYLHNHARMWFASIWVFTLELPWQLGADFFFRHLVDGDAASNTLGWRWVCGLHTKGKTYLARVSNITSYTDKRFDPSGKLAVSAPPVRESVEHPSLPLPAAQVLQRGSGFGLAITEGDCSPESLVPGETPETAIVLPGAGRASPLPSSRLVREFTISALLDTASRAEAHFDVPVHQAQTEDWGDALTEWADGTNIKIIVTNYAPVGPAAERLQRARLELEKRGIRLLQVRRHYDSIAWPHAARGFFKLKAQIPQLLVRLGITGDAESTREAG